jgi:GTPase SAR1 family protein
MSYDDNRLFHCKIWDKILQVIPCYSKIQTYFCGTSRNNQKMKMEKHYTARKLKPVGKETWVLEFRHPLLKDNSGKIGRKVRKGLGTKDDSLAQNLVDQMNQLLSNETYWQPASREQALEKFDSGIVNAFYEGIDYVLQDYEKIREKIIPLYTKKEGYARILLLGATGAGKTTLLRQIMGTDPVYERFPATSTARTTVFDTEIILANGDYKAVVTFFTESETRQMIKESIKKSMAEYYIRKDDSHILRVFLEDRDQRFRLSYLIGKIKENKKYSDFDDYNEDDDSNTELRISDDEQKAYEAKINEYLKEIKQIANQVIQRITKEYDLTKDLSEDDKTLIEEITLSEFDEYDEDDLTNLVDNVLLEIKERFKQLDANCVVAEKFGWPIYWETKSKSRADFLKSIRYFSSNSSTMFGKLLTPLVSGMRVQGPFKPDYLQDIPKLILLDGEGLGHISDTSSNLPYKTIKKFDISDAIVLVDNSQNPMLASSYAVIKSIAITGHSEKLSICFTHFDGVKGDNLPSIGSKVEHIFGSVDNLLEKLKTELGYDINRFFSTHLHESSYYLANLDEKLVESAKYKFTINQIKKLVNSLERSILVSDTEINAVPIYDISTLIFKIRRAAMEFHNLWDGYLYGSASIAKEHFSKVKALTLRLGFWGESEYKSLTPISDFGSSFNGQINNFLSNPTSWNPSNPADEDKQSVINEISKRVSKKIYDYAVTKIKDSKINDWQTAYYYRGVGSSRDRAKKIDFIYLDAVPIPDDEIKGSKMDFLKDIMKIITDTISENGGQISSRF